MLSESTENREMSAYDNMCVLIDATLVARVVPSNSSTSSYTNKKIFLRKTVGWARLLLLFLLVVSPASAGPVRERTHRPTTHTRHTSLEWQITQQRLRRSEPRHHSSSSSSSSRGGSSRYSSMSDRVDDAGSSRSRRMTSVHWSQPCTGLLRNPNNTQRDLSGHILHELSTAHSFLIDFRMRYAQSAMDSTRDNPWDALVEKYETIKLPFLVAAPPENPGDFNSQLLHAYEKMQRLAVGIEQVTLDRAIYEGDLLPEFRTIETHIVKILCQLHYAMVHQEVKPPENVTKMIMGEEYRDLEGSRARITRDSAIVREYNSAIDNLKDIFVKFENP